MRHGRITLLGYKFYDTFLNRKPAGYDLNIFACYWSIGEDWNTYYVREGDYCPL